MKPLTLAGVALRSGSFFFKSHLAICLGIAAATAVIVGALVVGDSVRGSLRGLVLDRLANVQCLMHTRTFFDPALLGSLSTGRAPAADSQPATPAPPQSIVGLIYLPSSTVEHRTQTSVNRGSKVQLFGVDGDFWKSISTAARMPSWNEDEIALGQGLAEELNVQIGDELTLRFQPASGVPADNPLGKRDDSSLNLPRQKVVAILPDQELGGLSFNSTQSMPRNVFCSLVSLQDLLECGTQINAALVLSSSTTAAARPLSAADCQQLNEQLKPTIEDYGLQLEHVVRRFPDSRESANDNVADVATADSPSSPQTIFDYYQLTSRALILDSSISNDVFEASEGRAIRLISYLGNAIAKVQPLPSDLQRRFQPDGRPSSDSIRFSLNAAEIQLLSREVPYSIVVGVDGGMQTRLQEFTTISREETRLPYCWINSWLAEQIEATAGDWIDIRYFEPETIDGVEHERSMRCMIVGVVPLTEPVQGFQRDRPALYQDPPTVFNDPNLTPNVPGLTDKDSIANWEAPFQLDLDLILPADDDYYDNHRLTPKVYLPYQYASSTRVFGSRFGNVTALQFPADSYQNEAAVRDEIETALLANRAAQGFVFVPIREQLLRSATGTTPFDMLFLSLSFFVIVAALVLVALLFKLGITQRATQLGLLTAQGFSASRIRGLLLRELSGVALIGATLGIALGIGYARLMIAALESWWVGAISNPFLSFSFTAQSLLIGAVVGTLMSLVTIYFSLRSLTRLAPLQLLRGQTEIVGGDAPRMRRGFLAAAGFLALGALGLIVAAVGQSGMARAGSFFGSGMLLLVAALIACHQWLRSSDKTGGANPTRSNLLTLAWSTIHRNPLRSSLALGLLSVASFLIASMSVFHVAPDPRGYGGFDLIGESALPIYRNIGSSSVRQQLLGEDADSLRDTLILPFRVLPGEDASCNNLFQVAQPTILGVPRRLSQLNDVNGSAATFQWAATTAPNDPWKLLEQSAVGDSFSPVPVILDQNTAAWSLKQGAALGAIIQLQYGERTLYFRTVGLLANSVLQGKLLIGDENFRLLFPEINGSQYFLIRSGDAASAEAISQALEKGWSSEGLDITSSAQTLASLLGVQNTYISAFQSLGALGLLLGTFGLIAVQLRSVVERRHELALMQAVGFSKNRIGWMLTLETALLLGSGLLIGSLAAAVALVPYLIENGTQVSALQPLAMLVLVLFVGFIASLLAVRAALKRSVLENLRAE